MKRILLIITLLVSVLTFAQNNGITYQAVIYSASGESIPGIQNPNSPLVNKAICLQFNVIDSNTQTEYQEKVTVTTDSYGMVNLVIGNGTQTGGYASSFNTIVWSNSKKYLKVSLDQSGACSTFEEISNQLLTYVPFALAADSAESVSGIVGIAHGGTNATTVIGAKTNLQLQNVDNTSDLNKPLSTATQNALNTKIDKVAGKGLSTEDFTTAEKTKLASLSSPDLSGYVTTSTLNNAVTNKFVDLTTNQTVAGNKTFTTDINIGGLIAGKGKGQNNYNTAFGAGALNSSNANGTRNTAIGYLALTQYAGNTFDNNTGVGYFNMIGLTTGYGNTSIGAETMFNVGTASNNTGVGNQSLINAAGDNNVGVGARSGDGLTTGTNNPFIGTQARTTSAGAAISNSTALGYGAVVTENNTIQLGNLGVANVKTSGAITASGFKTPTGTSSQYLMADGSVSNSSSTTGVDLTTDQTIAGVKTFSPVLTAVADNTSLIGLNIDPQFNEGSFSGINKTALKLKGDLSFAEGANYLKFANGSMLGDVYNNGTDPSGTVDLFVPEGASWLGLSYGHRNYFWMDNASAYLSTGSVGQNFNWTFNGNNGVTELPGAIRAGGITYPATDGSAGQVLSTDGSGALSWITPPTVNTSDFVDLTTNQTINGEKYFSQKIVVSNDVRIGNPGGDANIMLGSGSFVYAQPGNHNTAVGTMTLSVASGDSNTAIGSNAMRQGQTTGNGSNNTAIGSRALTNATDSNYNVAVGVVALENALGDKNTGIGSAALQGNNTGINNVGLGYRSGVTNATGNDNTFIGSEADAASNSLSNATAIGKGALVDSNNTIQLGNTEVTNVKTSGKLTTGTITLPNTDGTTGQVLATDGAGVVSWSSPSVKPSDIVSSYSTTAGYLNFETGVFSAQNWTELNSQWTITSGWANTRDYNGTAYQGSYSIIAPDSQDFTLESSKDFNLASLYIKGDGMQTATSVEFKGYSASGALVSSIIVNSSAFNYSFSNVNLNFNGIRKLVFHPIGYDPNAMGGGSFFLDYFDVSILTSNNLNSVNGILKSDGNGNITAAVVGTDYLSPTGTASQFIKADGSIDTNTYVASNTDNVAIGYVAGSGGQGLHSIAIGSNVAQGPQAEGGVGVGYAAAQYNQGENAVAIGKFAGQVNQAANSVAIGNEAGINDQQQESVAIGVVAGRTSQGFRAIAIGALSGNTTQQQEAVAIGAGAGNTNQGIRSIAIGTNAGFTTQGQHSVALGDGAGTNSQGENAIAIGTNAGFNNQAPASVAIGVNAQASAYNSVAIGANASVSTNNTIQLGDAGITNVNTYGSITANAAISNEITSDLTIDSNNVELYKGRVLICNPSSPITITFATGLATGFNCMILQKSDDANKINLAGAVGVTMKNRNNYTATAGNYAVATVVSIGGDIIVTAGDMQ